MSDYDNRGVDSDTLTELSGGRRRRTQTILSCGVKLISTGEDFTLWQLLTAGAIPADCHPLWPVAV